MGFHFFCTEKPPLICYNSNCSIQFLSSRNLFIFLVHGRPLSYLLNCNYTFPIPILSFKCSGGRKDRCILSSLHIGCKFLDSGFNMVLRKIVHPNICEPVTSGVESTLIDNGSGRKETQNEALSCTSAFYPLCTLECESSGFGVSLHLSHGVAGTA